MSASLTATTGPFPGFSRLSEQIYFLETPSENGAAGAAAATEDEPDVIILYGWGDGRPKNVVKYIDGYRTLYPHARMVVVLATTFKAAYQPLPERTQGMMPVVDALFDGTGNLKAARGGGGVLLHAMSNAGGINLASTLNAYSVRYGRPLPHRLTVLDSTPGGVVFRENVLRWSRAMAIGTAKRFPWPFAFTQAIWYVYLWLNKFWEFILRRHHAGAYSREAVNKSAVIPTSTPRLYFYSKEDDIIFWKDIEKHAEEAQALGYSIETKMFAGTDHVGHMRKYPTEYWAAVAEKWKKSAPPA